MRNERILFLLMIAIAPFAHARGTSATLCQKQESVIFSCHVGKKIVSVCASQAPTPGLNRPIYRFGKIRSVELEIPKRDTPASDRVEGAFSSGAGGSGEQFLRFSENEFEYVVYFRWYHPLPNIGCGGSCEHAGLLVYRHGKMLASNKCVSRSFYLLRAFDQKFRDEMGISNTDNWPDFPD